MVRLARRAHRHGRELTDFLSNERSGGERQSLTPLPFVPLAPAVDQGVARCAGSTWPAESGATGTG